MLTYIELTPRLLIGGFSVLKVAHHFRGAPGPSGFTEVDIVVEDLGFMWTVQNTHRINWQKSKRRLRMIKHSYKDIHKFLVGIKNTNEFRELKIQNNMKNMTTLQVGEAWGCSYKETAIWCRQFQADFIDHQMGVSKNSVPLNPMVLLIIIPIIFFLFHWEYTLFSDKPKCERTECQVQSLCDLKNVVKHGSGWRFQPLWQIWVRQLGWWHSQYNVDLWFINVGPLFAPK